jgi:hypothetical protein
MLKDYNMTCPYIRIFRAFPTKPFNPFIYTKNIHYQRQPKLEERSNWTKEPS